MSERDEERRAAAHEQAVAYVQREELRDYFGGEINHHTEDALIGAHKDGILAGRLAARREQLRVERELSELRAGRDAIVTRANEHYMEQVAEIAALRDLVRLADSYMEDFGQWRDSPAVRRALEEGR